MRILINDLIQFSSNAPDELKSPSLADDYTTSTSGSITLDDTYNGIDCFGVGNTDATTVTINTQVITLETDETIKNGLYLLNSSLNTNTISWSHNGTYIGRLAIGFSRFLGVSPQREVGFYTTVKKRETASANVVEAAGGVSGKRFNVEVRYKIDETIFDDFETAFTNQISKGFPFFIFFDKTLEQNRIPWKRVYASTDNELLFQSAVNRFLYGRRFSFTENF